MARQVFRSGSNLIQIGVNIVFSSSAKQPTFLSLVGIYSPSSKYGFVVFYREFTKLATGVSFFVLVASAVAMVEPGVLSLRRGQGRRPPLTTASAPPFRFIQNGKRNNNFQT